MLHCLALQLVNSHREAKSHRELPPCELERALLICGLVVHPWNKNLMTHKLPSKKLDLLLDLVRIPQLQLQTPFDGSKFFRIITGHPAFSSSFDSGSPKQLILFKYSMG